MPRLGTDDDETGGDRNRVQAYANRPQAPPSPLTLLFLIAAILIGRQVMTNDYRADMRTYLLANGKTEEVIDRLVPLSGWEKQKASREKSEQVQSDMELMAKQIDELQWKVFGTNQTSASSTSRPSGP